MEGRSEICFDGEHERDGAEIQHPHERITPKAAAETLEIDFTVKTTFQTGNFHVEGKS
jgi:hypothetical protein